MYSNLSQYCPREFGHSVLFTADCMELMNQILPASIPLTITSPPYDGLREYGKKGYIFPFEEIARGLWNITAQGGIVVWIVGDQTKKGSESGSSLRQALYFMELGFNLHDTMIYQKNNFSNPSSNRYHQVWEYMFVFSKGKPSVFNPLMDRKNIYAGQIGSWGKNTVTQVDGSKKVRRRKFNTEYGMRHNVWKYKTSKNGQNDKESYAHPASFPEELVKDHILSWSNVGTCVFDPMCGSGTVPVMAERLNRYAIACDIAPEYIEIAARRMENYCGKAKT